MSGGSFDVNGGSEDDNDDANGGAAAGGGAGGIFNATEGSSPMDDSCSDDNDVFCDDVSRAVSASCTMRSISLIARTLG